MKIAEQVSMLRDESTHKHGAIVVLALPPRLPCLSPSLPQKVDKRVDEKEDGIVWRLIQRQHVATHPDVNATVASLTRREELF